MLDDERTFSFVRLFLLRPIGNLGDVKLHKRPSICRDPRMLCGNLLAKDRMQTIARQARGQITLGSEGAIVCYEDELVTRAGERDVEQALLLLRIA